MGRRVVSEFAIFIQAFDVFIVNFRYVANNVGQGRAIGVEAAFIAFHLNAREAVLVNSKAGDLDFGQVRFHRNGGKAVRA